MLKQEALEIYEAGLAAVDPARILAAVDLPHPERGGRLFVFGAGKAAASLGAAVEKRLSGETYSGRIVVKHGHGLPLERIDVEEGGHPLPDADGQAATRRLLADLKGMRPEDRVIFLLTGGASALLVAPAKGVTLKAKIRVTELLLRAGATIQELNAVRKHLSAVKGGRLLERMVPARVLALVVSDVIGDDLSSIGSGPTVGDPTTFEDALRVLERYRVVDEAPEVVVEHLRAGASGKVAETPKPGSPLLRYAEHVILASNRTALRAARSQAGALGFETKIFAEEMVGPVHDRASRFARTLAALPSRSALLAGGELTLEVSGTGLGGRAQEFALVAARELSDKEGVLVLAAGTDGSDGPTDAAGAFADGRTWESGRARGLEPEAFLENNDSYHFLDAVEALLRTGPTGTNVNDLFIGLVA